MRFVTETDKNEIRNRLDQQINDADKLIDKARERYYEYDIDRDNTKGIVIALIIVAIVIFAVSPIIVGEICYLLDKFDVEWIGSLAFQGIAVYFITIAIKKIRTISRTDILYEFLSKVGRYKSEISAVKNNLNDEVKEMEKAIKNNGSFKLSKKLDFSEKFSQLEKSYNNLHIAPSCTETLCTVMRYLSSIMFNIAILAIGCGKIVDWLYYDYEAPPEIMMGICVIITGITFIILAKKIDNEVGQYIAMSLSALSPILVAIALGIVMALFSIAGFILFFGGILVFGIIILVAILGGN